MIIIAVENGLSGSIPKEVDLFSNLNMLWINGNAVGGFLPTQLGNMHSLVRIDATDNELTGTIPSELSSLSLLERLNLRNNKLSGSIPSNALASLPNLSSLQVDRNALTGDATPICLARPSIVLAADCEELTCPCCLICCDGDEECEFTV